MRNLTSNEKDIVKLLVNLKQKGDLVELQTARILRKRLAGFLAIAWTSKPKDCLTVYYEANDADAQINEVKADNALKKYFEICDYLYFLQELEENKMVAIQTISSEKPNEDIRTLYDKELYEYNKDSGNFCLKGTPKELKKIDIWSHQNTYTNVVSLLNDYLYGKIIYPLPLLEDFVKNNYESIENRQFNEQMCWTRLSVFIASIAVVLTALFDGFSTETSIDKNQLRTLEQAIINSKTVISDTITIKLSDTLKVEDALQKP
ncbi:hypothetical protein [Bacteroides ovatus]|uniref:hypothetical protein n=1 Tax=Bacteroides ovatus TaxID=28116 RepID=UPI0032197760